MNIAYQRFEAMNSSLLGLGLLLLPALCPGAEPVPLIHVHAHNDYEHKRPLFDALDHGFCSVEADIYLVDGQLLVAHDRSKVKPERTLQALYLDPLRERVKKNGGRVYPGGPECVLLIDEKTRLADHLSCPARNPEDTMPTCSRRSSPGQRRPTPSGSSSPATAPRTCSPASPSATPCVDGELADLDSGAPADLIPWISSNWATSFKWRGTGPMPEAEKLKLQTIVAKAHAQGRQVRFWGAPDQPVFWGEMLANGVDLINTDDLDGAQKFLLSQVPPG